MQIFDLLSSLLEGAKKQQITIFERFDGTGQLSVERSAVGERADEAGLEILDIHMTGMQWSLSTEPKPQDCKERRRWRRVIIRGECRHGKKELCQKQDLFTHFLNPYWEAFWR